MVAPKPLVCAVCNRSICHIWNVLSGLGVYFGVRELLRTEARNKTFGIKNLKMDEQRIVVQGFGNGFVFHPYL
jgi:hypothetical protein